MYEEFSTAPDNLNEYSGNAESPVEFQEIPDFDRTYTVTITNPTKVAIPITLFGANQFLMDANFGLPAPITVTVEESSYAEMLRESQLSPFVICGFRMVDATHPAQLDQVLTIRKRDGNGQNCSYPLQVNSYLSAFQYQNIREVYPYNISVEGTTQISFTMIADFGTPDPPDPPDPFPIGIISNVLTITFFVCKRINLGNILHNRPVLEVSSGTLPFIGKQQLSLSASSINALKK